MHSAACRDIQQKPQDVRLACTGGTTASWRVPLTHTVRGGTHMNQAFDNYTTLLGTTVQAEPTLHMQRTQGHAGVQQVVCGHRRHLNNRAACMSLLSKHFILNIICHLTCTARLHMKVHSLCPAPRQQSEDASRAVSAGIQSGTLNAVPDQHLSHTQQCQDAATPTVATRTGRCCSAGGSCRHRKTAAAPARCPSL